MPSGVFKTADGWLQFLVMRNDAWVKFCASCWARRQLATDPRFADEEPRMTNEAALLAIVRPAIAEKPTAYWSERLREADIMHERLNSFREFLRHPQAEAIGLISWLEPPARPSRSPMPNIAGIAPFAKGTPRATPPPRASTRPKCCASTASPPPISPRSSSARWSRRCKAGDSVRDSPRLDGEADRGGRRMQAMSFWHRHARPIPARWEAQDAPIGATRNTASPIAPTKKIEQQPRDGLGLLLLHPVAGAVDEMAGEHARASLLLHALEDARRLEDAPVARP